LAIAQPPKALARRGKAWDLTEARLNRVPAALLALAIVLAAGCARGPEPRQLQARLRRELPIGTPSSQVDAYLADERSYLAGVRNVGSRFSFTREDIAIRIDFDKDGRLTAIRVTPFFTYHGR
jgi:hypothetical protein